MRGIPLCLPVLLLSLSFALHAMAGNWGENWGTMIWEQSAPVVPSIKGVGLSVLLLSLVVATALRLRRHSQFTSLLLVVLGAPLIVGAMVPHSLSNGAMADAEELNANFDSLGRSVSATLAVPHVFTNGTISNADEVNANFTAIKSASSPPFSDLSFPYVFTNGTPANADEINANFSARDRYFDCVNFYSFPTQSLPKSGNGNFQWKSWKTGCMHGFKAPTVVGCRDDCDAPDGCCGGGGGTGYPVCQSNSCSGGGCCTASKQICRAACEVSHSPL